MKVLDLDMDYFLDYPVNDISFNCESRVEFEECKSSVWTEERVCFFLENNLGLSKVKKSKGRIVIGHDEALYFWDELIQGMKLKPPFSVVHVDSHADLGFGDLGMTAVLDVVIQWPVEYRRPRYCCDIEVDNRRYNINIGNYLLYALAFRWISDLVYCGNPNHDCGDVPPEIVVGDIPSCEFDYVLKREIKLKMRNQTDNNESEEPTIPFCICPKVEDVHYDEEFDYVLLAQSPNYTPENADFIMEIFREYIDEI